MLNVLAIFLGGGIGAVLRYLVGFNLSKYFEISLPISTFLVNIIGSFVIGFLFFFFSYNDYHIQIFPRQFFSFFFKFFTIFRKFNLFFTNYSQ